MSPKKDMEKERVHYDKTRPRLWTIPDIMSHDFGKEEWVVESLIPKQGITAFSGSPGDFKTFVSIHIGLSMMRNTPVFGKFKVMQGNVLVIDEEDHIRGIQKRMRLLGVKDTDNGIYYFSQSGFKIDNVRARGMIVEIIKEKNIKLVILDSFVRIHAQDENDARSVAKVFSAMQDFTKAGASILFTHHHRKQQGFGNSNNGQMMRGSSDILAAVDCHLSIKRKPDEDRLIIQQPKLRQDEALKPFEVWVVKDVIDEKGKACVSGFEYIGDHDERKSKAKEVVEAVTLLLADAMKSRDEIHEILGGDFGSSAIDDGILLAKDSGVIERVPKEELPKEGRRRAYYRLRVLPANKENELLIS